MKKAVTALSITSTVFSVLALLLAFAFLTFLWKPMCMLYTETTEIINNGPIISWNKVVSILGCLIISLCLLLSRGSYRNITIEIISIIFLMVVSPPLTQVLALIQQAAVNYMGERMMVTYTITNRILDWMNILINPSVTLCLVTCGMRIAEKIITGKMRVAQNG